MNDLNKLSKEESLSKSARVVHLGILIFGIFAMFTGEMADDYKKVVHNGYELHLMLGIGLAMFIMIRGITGIFGSKVVRFTQWLPCTKERIAWVLEDIRGLLRFKLPDRPVHRGLSGVVEGFGLLAFFWMAATGVLLALTITPGQKAVGIAHAIKEAHEAGMAFLVLFLAMHVGAVILHAIAGKHIWKKAFFLKYEE
ncbi:MAG: cytochrome b/b6 domain-containing protein [Dissulfurispiraceae bacterium]|jgi:cytochrome b|nr:cytochrome b/b6 domain-containing protein [Dissulfurispiraceae bacterium]